MKVFISAYACEPDRGSEPGVGWGWANGLAQHDDVSVVTRANNEEVIDNWYRENDPESASRRPSYIYYDPPGAFLWLKRKKLLPVQLFYIIWQIGVVMKYRGASKEYDIVHHLTFNSMMMPGFWWAMPVPVVLGPLGGTSKVALFYTSLFGKKIWKERFRSKMITFWNCLPWLRFSYNEASLVLAANSETEAYLSKEYSEITKGMLEIGMDVSQVVAGPVDVTDSTIINIHWIGVIEPWKAWSLALEAVAAAKKKLNGRVKINMTMLGRGSEEAEAATLVQTLGLQDEVTLLQRVQVDELHDMVQQSDVLLFSSVKDTSGTVVLEAMSLGKAVVCLNHQGVGDMTTDETAIRVDPASISLTVDGLSNAIVKLADDPILRASMGERGRDRILEKYTWGAKSQIMHSYYSAIVKGL